MTASDILNNKWFQLGAVGVVSFSSGVAVGYFIKKSQVEEFVYDESTGEYILQDDEEGETSLPDKVIIEETTETLTVVDGDDISVVVVNEGDRELMEEILDQEKYRPLEDEVSTGPDEAEDDIEELPQPELTETESPKRENVFMSEDHWDYDEELAKRDPGKPYVIHRDEYFGDERGFVQSTFTYYAGDNILVDEQDIPIAKFEDVVGELKFGHGSQDKNVVYVRNEDLRGEYEILKSEDSYEIVVLGYDTESAFEKRDSRQSTPRFRED